MTTTFPRTTMSDVSPGRVLLVDSCPLLAVALRGLLAANHVSSTVDQVDDAPRALAFCADRPVDVVVTDVHLNGRRDGIELVRRLKTRPSAPRVLMLASDAGDDIVSACRANEVDAFVHRSARTSVVMNALSTLLGPRASTWYVGATPEPAAEPAPALTAGGSAAPVLSDDLVDLVTEIGLTDRERQVLALVLVRCSNDEIARNLHLAKQTVKNYVSCVLQKLDFASRSELFASSYGRAYTEAVARLVVADVADTAALSA